MNGSSIIPVLVLAALGASVVSLTPFADGLVESVIFNPKPGADATPGRLGIAGEEVFLETWPKLPKWFKGALRNSPDAAALLEREAVKKVTEETEGEA